VLGIWNAEGVDDNGKGEAFCLFPPGHDQSVEVFEPFPYVTGSEPGSIRLRTNPKLHGTVFGSVWDFYSPWKHPVTGLGPLFIIDECHLAMPAKGTDDQVIEWFKLHRHFNADVLLATQSFRDMSQPIARLFEILIRCRKGTVLGSSKSYIRKVFAGYRGAEISTEIRPYQSQYFSLYKSHTQGNSVAESGATDVKPFNVKFKRFTWVFWVFALAVCAYVFWPDPNKGSFGMRSAKVTKAASSGAAVSPQAAASAPLSPASAPVVVDLEPLKDKQIHISGWMRTAKGLVNAFVVSASGVRQFDVLLADLKGAGYVYESLGECIGYLHWKTKTRTVTCDAPVLASGSSSAPVVIDVASGKRSDDLRSTSPKSVPVLASSIGGPQYDNSDLDSVAFMHKRHLN
jgi:zona occludens toxin